MICFVWFIWGNQIFEWENKLIAKFTGGLPGTCTRTYILLGVFTPLLFFNVYLVPSTVACHAFLQTHIYLAMDNARFAWPCSTKKVAHKLYIETSMFTLKQFFKHFLFPKLGIALNKVFSVFSFLLNYCTNKKNLANQMIIEK